MLYYVLNHEDVWKRKSILYVTRCSTVFSDVTDCEREDLCVFQLDDFFLDVFGVHIQDFPSSVLADFRADPWRLANQFSDTFPWKRNPLPLAEEVRNLFINQFCCDSNRVQQYRPFSSSWSTRKPWKRRSRWNSGRVWKPSPRDRFTTTSTVVAPDSCRRRLWTSETNPA